VPAVEASGAAVGGIVAALLSTGIPAAPHEEGLLPVHGQAQRLVPRADLRRQVGLVAVVAALGSVVADQAGAGRRVVRLRGGVGGDIAHWLWTQRGYLGIGRGGL
jgi:hypothetical protein